MSEEGARFWTVMFGGVTAIGLVFGGIYTAMQYLDSRSKDSATYNLQIQTAQLEAKKPYFSKHLDLCSQVTDDAATIATTSDPKKKKGATEDFWRLYWGPMGTVEEGGVEKAMVAFGDCLQGKCREDQDLTQLSLALAHKCRSEISHHFELKLAPLVMKHPADQD
jgi:hypothetical protein